MAYGPYNRGPSNIAKVRIQVQKIPGLFDIYGTLWGPEKRSTHSEKPFRTIYEKIWAKGHYQVRTLSDRTIYEII